MSKDTAALAIVGALLFSSCASQRPAQTEPTAGQTQPPPTPSQDSPSLEVERGTMTAAMRVALRGFIRAREIKEEKMARAGDAAFVLLTLEDGGEEQRAIALLERREGRWRVSDFPQDFWKDLPKPDSDQFPLLPVQASTQRALGGWVDPTVTRVETIDAGGDLYDVDTVQGGAAIVLSPEWGQLRIYRRDGLISVSGVATGEDYLAFDDPVDEEAREVGDRFLETLLSNGWQAAGESLREGVPADQLLPPLEELLNSLQATVKGPSRMEGAILHYPLTTRSGEATLDLWMIREPTGWGIALYTFHLGESPTPD